jgi:sugar phosphate permease
MATGIEQRNSAASGTKYRRADIFKAWQLLSVSPAFWLVSLMAFFWYANYMVLLGMWGGPYLREVIGLDRAQSSTVLLCISFGYICGSLLLGKAIDFFHGSLATTILLGQSALLILMTAMLGPAEVLPQFALVIIFFLIGLVSASGVIIYPLARNLLPHESTATAMTCVNFFLLLGAASVQHAIGFRINFFTRLPTGYPAIAYHSAFLIPICGLSVTLILFLCGRKLFV